MAKKKTKKKVSRRKKPKNKPFVFSLPAGLEIDKHLTENLGVMASSPRLNFDPHFSEELRKEITERCEQNMANEKRDPVDWAFLTFWLMAACYFIQLAVYLHAHWQTL